MKVYAHHSMTKVYKQRLLYQYAKIHGFLTQRLSKLWMRDRNETLYALFYIGALQADDAIFSRYHIDTITR